MKDGFKSLEIEPEEGYLDFIGPAKSTLESTDNQPMRVLKGQVKFNLTKSVKIRSMSVKFKGFTNVSLKQPHTTDINCPLLPKLKVPIFGRTNLPAGDHIIPWEIDIPNIYPRSLLIKRGSIHYKIVVFVSIGIARSLTAEYPIVIRRHLLPYKELSPLIETKLYQRTIPGKFHYEIDTPQIVCIEQEYIPMAIKYVSIATQKPLQAIRTRLIQIELYKRQPLNKQDSDLTCNNKDVHIFDLDQKVTELNSYTDTHIKYMKKTAPAIIHIPNNDTSAWKKPCLIRHSLHPYLSYTLSSPLISIYHQLEITFQFGMKFEEIKTKIPIIIASVPSKEYNDEDDIDNALLKYTFEDPAKSQFLPSKLSSMKKDSQTDDSYSVLRDSGILSNLSDEDMEGPFTGRVTPLMFARANPHRRAFSPTPESSSTPVRQQLKKFASALDLNTTSEEESFHHDFAEERPRTTTPTMKRHLMPRKVLAPINVNLANGKETVHHPLGPPLGPPPQTELPLLPGQRKGSNSSDVLPPPDRILRKPQKVAASNNDCMDDLKSSYSDSSASSSNNAPSLSSSVTLSTNKSHLTLHSRPPSPVFSPAPGLPATIALRPQQQNDGQAIEELFPADSIMSPALNTVASSTLLSPRTSSQRRIALSTISSLTNESIQFGSSIISSTNTSVGRSSSTVVDPEMYLMMMQRRQTPPHGFDLPPPPPHRYLNAKLPPIPTTATSSSSNTATENKRLTRLYMEDSDDEENEDNDDGSRSPSPLPPLPLYNRFIPSDNISLDTDNSSNRSSAPPRLPRLSFGKDFGLQSNLWKLDFSQK